MANLSGADLTGAIIANANFEGAVLGDTKGLGEATGTYKARNLD